MYAEQLWLSNHNNEKSAKSDKQRDLALLATGAWEENVYTVLLKQLPFVPQTVTTFQFWSREV